MVIMTFSRGFESAGQFSGAHHNRQNHCVHVVLAVAMNNDVNVYALHLETQRQPQDHFVPAEKFREQKDEFEVGAALQPCPH